MRLSSLRSISSYQAGVSLIETVVALGLLGIISVTFLTGVTVTSRAAFITDEQATTESLAISQMEWALNPITTPYTVSATGYTAAPIPSGIDYANYSVNITAGSVPTADVNIQKITVTVRHSDKQVITLESYKVNR